MDFTRAKSPLSEKKLKTLTSSVAAAWMRLPILPSMSKVIVEPGFVGDFE